jgi:hypothetical protein
MNKPADNDPLSAAELRCFLEVGVSQLEGALTEADGRVVALTSAIMRLVNRARELRGALAPDSGAAAVPAAGALAIARGAALAIEADAAAATVALQFYDKLVQRLAHVRDGLSIPAATIDQNTGQPVRVPRELLDKVRERYSMVEERVLFDFLVHGTGPKEMLRALNDLRVASDPGTLELF